MANPTAAGTCPVNSKVLCCPLSGAVFSQSLQLLPPPSHTPCWNNPLPVRALTVLNKTIWRYQLRILKYDRYSQTGNDIFYYLWKFIWCYLSYASSKYENTDEDNCDYFFLFNCYNRNFGVNIIIIIWLKWNHDWGNWKDIFLFKWNYKFGA